MWKSPSIESLSSEAGMHKRSSSRKNSLKIAYEAFLPKLRKLSHQEDPMNVRPRSYSTTPHESPKKMIGSHNLLTSTVKRSASSSAPLTTIESGIELADLDASNCHSGADFR